MRMDPVRVSVLGKNGDVESSLSGIALKWKSDKDDSFYISFIPVSYSSKKLDTKHFIKGIASMIKRHKKVLPDYQPTEYIFSI